MLRARLGVSARRCARREACALLREEEDLPDDLPDEARYVVVEERLDDERLLLFDEDEERLLLPELFPERDCAMFLTTPLFLQESELYLKPG